MTLDSINTNAWSLMAQLLDQGAEEFNRHASNTLELPDTPENRALLLAMEKWNDGQEHTEEELLDEHRIVVFEDGKEVAYLHTMDWYLARYFAHLARVMADEENEPRKTWVVNEHVTGGYAWTISGDAFPQLEVMLRQVRDRDIVMAYPGAQLEVVLWLWKKLELDQKFGNVYFEAIKEK